MAPYQKWVYKMCLAVDPTAVERALDAMKQVQRRDLPYLASRATLSLFLEPTFNPL